MRIESIIRAKGGTEEREVRIENIVIHDIRTSPLFLPDERWIGAVARYYDDLVALLEAVREDMEFPEEFFVPDLFHTGIRLPKEEREMMLDMWHLGHDLAIGADYESGDVMDFLRNDVGGTVFVREERGGR
jgi:hypothetical protein